MQWDELFGFAAAAAVLASFCMSSIVSLRSVAILSNVLFITFGALGHIRPVLFLHAALLPINLVKLYQIARSRRLDSTPSDLVTKAAGYLSRLRHRTPSSDDRNRRFVSVVKELK